MQEKCQENTQTDFTHSRQAGDQSCFNTQQINF